MSLIAVDLQGRITMVYDDKLNSLLKQGKADIKRASNVEPNDQGQWVANLAPIGGPVLGSFELRSDAIAAEVEWLERNII